MSPPEPPNKPGKKLLCNGSLRARMIYLAELSKLVDENFNLFSPAEISRLVQADSVVEGEVKRCIGVVESVINGAVDRL